MTLFFPVLEFPESRNIYQKNVKCFSNYYIGNPEFSPHFFLGVFHSDCVHPVSYTHLDVYKRQGSRSVGDKEKVLLQTSFRTYTHSG